MTGAIAPRRETAPPQALAPEAAFSLPASPETQPSRTNASANSKPTCKNPNALGVSRTVEIDTTGGPGFGFEHFKQHDFLREKEVVLTFDDGPWPTTTAVVKALADECVLATFFAIGKHATYYPKFCAVLRRLATALGRTHGRTRTCRKNRPKRQRLKLKRRSARCSGRSAARAQEASFFRFPALRHPAEMVTYLGQRNIAVFSTDMDSFDFKLRKPEQIIKSIMTKLQKHGKGIVLMHDFQTGTSHAVPQLLAELKAGGYKIVHLKSRTAIQTLPEFDEGLQKDQKLPTVSQRPTSSIVRDIQ